MNDPHASLLIVDDNDLDVEVVSRMLRKHSLETRVVRARNGEEALGLLRPAKKDDEIPLPFAILLDLNMPIMNGLELLAELREDPALADVTVYVLSTSDRQSDVEAVKRFGVAGYLVKPIARTQLEEVIESIATTN